MRSALQVRPWIGILICLSPCLSAAFATSQEPQIPASQRASSSSSPPSALPAGGARRALLIGCSIYPQLNEEFWLKGPPNDVAATRTTLMDPRYGFADSSIVSLVHDAQSQDLHPTADNIRRQFERLCDQVAEGDSVFILLAGHGSQIPNTNPDTDLESDGLDEVFLPEDVSEWGTGSKLNPNEIIFDDQIGAWLDRLSSKGATVLFVADCCHAGSLNRGVGRSRQRFVPAALQRDEGALQESRGNRRSDVTDFRGRVFSIFAVPSDTSTDECPMPPDGEFGAAGVHGRLSYALNTVMRSARRPITYNELLQQIRWRYAGWSWSPHPYADAAGNMRDRIVFGSDEFPNRSRFAIRKTRFRRDIGYELNAGWLDQIEPGSIFAVYPAAGDADADDIIGHVRVLTASATKSRVVTCAFEGNNAVSEELLPTAGRCELVYRELGDARLPVAMVDHSVPGGRSTPEVSSRVKTVLNQILNDKRSLVRPASNIDEAEIYVDVVGDRVAVRGRRRAFCDFDGDWTRGLDEESAEAQQIILPFDVGRDFAKQLGDRLLMVSRAINLIRLAEEPDFRPSSHFFRARAPQYTVEVRVRRKGASQYSPVEDIGAYKLKNEDGVRIYIRNTGEFAIDLTGLVVESAYRINPLFMYETAGQRSSPRILPGEGKFFSIRISDNTFGVEGLVMIAVPGTGGSPASFDYLQQSLPRFSETIPRNRTVARRFDQRIESTLYNGSATRGLKRRDLELDIRRLSWRVVASEDDESSSQGVFLNSLDRAVDY